MIYEGYVSEEMWCLHVLTMQGVGHKQTFFDRVI